MERVDERSKKLNLLHQIDWEFKITLGKKMKSLVLYFLTFLVHCIDISFFGVGKMHEYVSME